MKQILIILGLFASVSTFAQSPRIKLNQITKDTVKGSVLISSPSDSGMVYSRDFYIAYGADTVLILYGDTLAATSGIISSVLSDGVTITGDGTTGNELKVDTSLIATIKALNDSLATISASTTPDNVTITGDGSVGNPLKVDTLLISTIKALNDTLTARGYLTANETITLSGDVTGSGTTAITATVVDDSHNHIISNVDFLQDSLDAKANDSDLANYVTLSGAEMITGAKTFTNTFTQSGGDANFDSGTLYVDENENRVGIGTSSPSQKLDTKGDVAIGNSLNDGYGRIFINQKTPRAKPTVLLVGVDDGTYNEVNFGGGTSLGYVTQTMLFHTASNDTTFGASVRMTIEGDGRIFMPNVYSDLISGTTRDLYIKDDGQLGYISSTAKSKTNIYDLNNVDFIYNLNPVSFNYRKQNDKGEFTDEFYEKTSYGLIAEEVVDVADYMVYYDKLEDGGFIPVGVNYSELITPMLKAIQQQKEEIDQLKTLITDLTNRLIILENK